LADAYDSSTAQATSDEGFAPWDNPFMPLPAAPVSVFSLPIPEAAESPALPTPVSEPSPISELPESPPALRSEIDYSELVSRAPEPQPIRSEADPAVIEQWARDLAEPEAAASAQAADSEPIEREQGSAPSYRVRIVAHASPRWQGARGAADADSRNLELSQLRANAVAGEVASLFAAIAGAGRSVSIDTVVAEDDGTVGIATDARGGRDTLLEANGNRLDNAAQRRRVDVTIESGRRVGGLAGLSDTYVTTVPTASTRWNINTEVSAGAQVGVGAGLQTVTLTNELSGQSMSGWIPMFQVGPEASLGASGSIWGGPSQFATDRPVDFSDFHRAFVAASSAGVSGFLGYQGSTISFPGLGTGDIDVSSWSAGSVGVGASAQFGLLLLLGDYPPAEIPVKNPTTYVVPYERTERGQDAHRVLFPTQSATISDTERALLDSLVRSVAERWR
jgi:outer membrane protein OmpA-like peptidoglycan-associated protein